MVSDNEPESSQLWSRRQPVKCSAAFPSQEGPLLWNASSWVRQGSLASNRPNRNLSLQGFFSSYFELGEDTFLCLVLPEIAHSNLLFSETRQASWHRVSLSCCANVSFALRKKIYYTMHHTVRLAKRGRKGGKGSRTGFLHARFNDFGKLSTWIEKYLNLTVSH